MHHQNFESTDNYIPTNSNSNSNPNHRRLLGSLNYFCQPIGSFVCLSSQFSIPNLHCSDPPPPYYEISSPPSYSFLSELILEEVFRSLFHFPDFHTFLLNSSPNIPSQFPDSYLSHSIAFPPEYELSFQSTTPSAITNGHEYNRYEYGTIIRLRECHSTRQIHVIRQRRSSRHFAWSTQFC